MGHRAEKTTNRPLTVVAVMLSVCMSALEVTMVSTAMPTVVGTLGGLSLYAWVFTAYVVVSTMSMPIAGKLADLRGRKPVMLVGIALFLCGSVAAGQARTMAALVGARALQGLGGGAMQSMGLTLMGDLFNVHERARIQGVTGMVWGLAGIVGPFLGGAIVRHAGWPWVFYLNVPFGLLSALVLARALHERVERREARLDLAGAALLGATVVLTLLGARAGVGLPALGGAALTGAAFLWVERRARDPLISLTLIARPLLRVATALGALIGGALMSMLTFVPLFVQGVTGGSATDAGAAIAPLAVGWPLASLVAGRLVERVGYRPLVRIGLAVTALSAVGLAHFLGPDASSAVPRVASAGFGVGLGFASTVTLIAVQGSVDFHERGMATASTMVARTLGGALAVGLLGELLARALGRDPTTVRDTARRLAGASPERAVDAARHAELASALAAGLTPVLWVIAALSVGALAVGLFFPKLRLGAERI